MFLDDINGLSFSQDAEGNWGYKPSGADSVIPFKTNNTEGLIAIKLASTAGTSFSINVADYYDGDISALTTANFICDLASISTTGSVVVNTSGVTVSAVAGSVTKSYNSSTGVFTAKSKNATRAVNSAANYLCGYLNGVAEYRNYYGAGTFTATPKFIPYLII